MSRVGKNPVAIPAGVQVAIVDRVLSAKGKLGELTLPLSDVVETTIEDGKVLVQPKGESKQARAMWGTTRALVNTMVKGVSEGFSKRLEINGVGYKAAVSGQTVTLSLGYSHDVIYQVPEGIKVVAEKPTLLVVSGANKQRVGQVAAEIRSYRGPEPYKGKGIKYESEVILRKEGKKK
ncbi:MAG: 50S ribosomal protein L6 [Alphaproteobacteria bacterium]|nr:50S ribosomal protein L6 [Alphaproteobacteria bacterium]TAD87286.1 MAG: 50S ribosomal protein L6 [Alphaproteobacteria bacterium]